MNAADVTVGADALQTIVGIIVAGVTAKTLVAGETEEIALRSRPYPSCCVKVRRSWSRSRRSQSLERARELRRTSRCRAGFSYTCPPSSISVSHERSNRQTNAA